MTKRRALMAMGGVILSLVAGGSSPAQAQKPMWWDGGPQRNLYIDVIFWGNFCPNGYMCPQAQDVLDYVNDLTSYLRGDFNPPGLEPALHNYGVTDIYPGAYVVGPQSVGNLGPPGTDQVGVTQVQNMVIAAQNGSYGGAYQVANSSQWVGQSLPTTGNRLPIVVSLGANPFTYYGGNFDGFHGNNGQSLWAFAQYESLRVVSHEIFEAMSDPYTNAPWHPNGWAADVTVNLPFGSYYPEVGDQCESDYSDSNGGFKLGTAGATGSSGSLQWFGTWSGKNISGVTGLTVNPPFLNAYSALYGATCEVFIPEQHAPMTAAFEYGGNGTQPLDLVYVDTNGHLQEVAWGSAGGAASGPYDLGPPAPGVRAVGKPSMVYSLYVGERIFVKGSDGGLWMHSAGGATGWTQLGGFIYGDPSAVLVNGGQLINVYVTGTDDHLYWYGLTGSTNYGWSAVPNGSGILGSPKALSRDGVNLIDVVVPTEMGGLEWLADNAGAWAAPVAIPTLGTPTVGAPTVTPQGTTQMEVLGNSDSGPFITSWNGSGWSSVSDTEFTVHRDDQMGGNYGIQGDVAVTAWGTNHVDAFGVSRSGNLYWWWANNDVTNPLNWTCNHPSDCSLASSLAGNANGVTPLLSSAPLASGDPLTISRYSGETEVFYRAASNGSLVHLTYMNGAWQAPQVVSASIQ